MSIEADIYTLLTNTDTGCASRIYPDILPQSVTYPAIVYEEEDIEYGLTFDGDNGYDQAFVRVTVISDDKAEIITAVSAIRAALHGFVGSSYEGNVLTNQIQGIILSGSGSGYAFESKIYQQDLRLEIHYQS
jgi:hypothetical protein